MNKPTIITINAGRDCQGDAKQPIDIEIHADTEPAEDNDFFDGFDYENVEHIFETQVTRVLD